ARRGARGPVRHARLVRPDAARLRRRGLRRWRDRPLERSLVRGGGDPRPELDHAADPVGLGCRPDPRGDYAAGVRDEAEYKADSEAVEVGARRRRDAEGVSVRVRMAPSPTGFLHIGGGGPFLFNSLLPRGRGGGALLRG